MNTNEIPANCSLYYLQKSFRRTGRFDVNDTADIDNLCILLKMLLREFLPKIIPVLTCQLIFYPYRSLTQIISFSVKLYISVIPGQAYRLKVGQSYW